MSNNQKTRYARVAEGIYRYKSGGFFLRHKVGGVTSWHKLKSVELQAARREAAEVRKTGIRVQSKQAARTIAGFSHEEVDAYRHAAVTTRKKVEGFHAKVLAHWPGGVNASVASAKGRDVEKCIADAVGACGASYRNQFIQYLLRVFQRALASKAIGTIPGADPGAKKKETVWKLRKVLPAVAPIPTVEQWRKVVKAIRSRKLSDTRDEAADVVEAFALLGLGQAEVASLQWQDVDLKSEKLRVRRRKTGVPFVVPINSAAVALFKRREKITGGSPTNKIFTIYSPKKAIEAACADLKYPSFTPRSFRKLYITEALRAGVNVKTIAEMQGHQDGGKLILRTYSAEVNSDELARAGTKMSAVFKTAPLPAGKTISSKTRKILAGKNFVPKPL